MCEISHQTAIVEDAIFPDRYMSLERFGDIFHDKLDTYYEND